jgi:hypothetical protein
VKLRGTTPLLLPCICMEMDFSKGFPAEVILTGKNYSWSQKLDYERVSLHCRSCFETCHLATHCPKGSRKNRKHQKSTWWVRSNDDHQVISKDCRQPPQDSENPSQSDPPIQPTLLSQDSHQESTQKSKKEASSLQVSDQGLQIQQSPLHQHVGKIRLMKLRYQNKKK